jgi:uncharacterized protein YbaR (Trm112 family)
MTQPPQLDPTLLDLVRCPRCHGTLAVDAPDGADEGGLTCAACSLRYPVRGGVPVLLVDDAVPTA